MCLQLIRTSTGPGSNLLWQICQFVDCRSSRTPGFGKLYLGRLRASLVSQTCADLLRLATAAIRPRSDDGDRKRGCGPYGSTHAAPESTRGDLLARSSVSPSFPMPGVLPVSPNTLRSSVQYVKRARPSPFPIELSLPGVPADSFPMMVPNWNTTALGSPFAALSLTSCCEPRIR